MGKSATIKYGSVVSRKVAIPDEIVKQVPSEWTDNLIYRFNTKDDKYHQAFVNEFGTFYRGFGPSVANPVGLNAVFLGFDGTIAEQKHWGYVQRGQDGYLVVPGWCTTAVVLNHPDKCPIMNIWTSKRIKHWYEDLPVGTDIRPLLRNQGYEL
jgi:hypothetical protein